MSRVAAGAAIRALRESRDWSLADLAAAFAQPLGPGHWDRAHFIVEAAAPTVICTAYWDDPARAAAQEA